ncbi:MAG: hypothetical protein KAR87_05330 [Candidatus Aenigmarchaeota archaeon]|nr:hypothetical protein [Candidatus Aenigmarchaeota archaeon]
MNFLEKLFGKREKTKRTKETEEKPLCVTIKFEQANAFLKETAAPFLESINDMTDSAIKNIKDHFKDLDENLDALEKAVPEEHAEDRPRKLMLGNRAAFIRKVKTFENNIAFPSTKVVPKIREFYKSLIMDMNVLLKDTHKNIYFSNMLFPDEMEKTIGSLREMGHIADQSIKELDSNKEKIEMIEQAENNIKKVHDLTTKKKTIFQSQKKSKENIKELQRKKEELIKELDYLNTSEERKTLGKEEEKLKSLEEEIDNIRNTIINMFSPLSKTMKKYERDSAGLSKEERNTLCLYIDSPVEALIGDKDMKTLDKIILNAENMIKEGGITLKDKKQEEKILHHMSRLKNHEELKDILVGYERTKRQAEETSNSIKDMNISERISSTEHELAALNENIVTEKENMAGLGKSIPEVDNEILLKVKELENELSGISGKDVTMSIDL